jgi:hypothetical protein
MIAIIKSAGAIIVRAVAALGLKGAASLAFLGPLGPIVSGVAGAIGSIITAVFEIVAALARSAEGRIVLALAALGLSFLYLRFHYMEEGRSLAAVQWQHRVAMATRSCQVAHSHKVGR